MNVLFGSYKDLLFKFYLFLCKPKYFSLPFFCLCYQNALQMHHKFSDSQINPLLGFLLSRF